MKRPADSPPVTQQANQDGWTLVTRRRRPPHFLPSPLSPPRQTKTLHSHSLTYAQILQRTPPAPRPKAPMTQQANQITIPNPTHDRSQHSPKALPYPPNPYQKEWWGRCFRCARKGHAVAECTFPRLTPTYSNEVQPVDTVSRPPLEPATTAITSAIQPHIPIRKPPTLEPGFDDLLAGSEPQTQPPMPSDRPKRISCYFNKTEQYQLTLQKLLRGIVVQPPKNLAGKLNLDQVAQTVAASAKVSAPQLRVATFSQDRFLVLLPDSVDRDEVVAAVPRRIWEDGFRFHSYSPLWEAFISIPIFKVWIDLHGVPIELCTDDYMARAVSSFSTFLGSMDPPKHGDYQTHSIFVATDNLLLIPHEIDIRIEGMVYTASVHPRNWLNSPVYHRVDLPPTWFSYPPPPSPITSSTSPSPEQLQTPPADPIWFHEDDVMPFSLKVLREIFRDFSPSDLPADLAACLAGNKAAISANHSTYRLWEQQNRELHPISPC